MTSDTIGERFDEQFPEWKQKNAQALHVKAFILAELERIALECDKQKTPVLKGQMSIEDYENAIGVNTGLNIASHIIRSAGESLK